MELWEIRKCQKDNQSDSLDRCKQKIKILLMQESDFWDFLNERDMSNEFMQWQKEKILNEEIL